MAGFTFAVDPRALSYVTTGEIQIRDTVCSGWIGTGDGTAVGCRTGLLVLIHVGL